jgi:diacylglycerol kinase
MAKENHFSFQARLKSFRPALSGFRDMLQTEHNARIHFIVTIAVILLGWRFVSDGASFALLIASIVMVWVAEAFNTVLEIMADLVVQERFSKTVKRAKDISAAAVLIATAGAVLVGILVLGPALFKLNPQS